TFPRAQGKGREGVDEPYATRQHDKRCAATNLRAGLAVAYDPGADRGLRFPPHLALSADPALPFRRPGLDAHAVAMGHERPGRAGCDANRFAGVATATHRDRCRGRAFLQPSWN